MRARVAWLVLSGAIISALIVSSRADALEIKRSVLSNGAVLLVSEQHHLPMVTISMAFDAGSRRDPKGKEGLAYLTAESLTEGTKELSSEQLNQKIDFMGSSLNVSAEVDLATAGMTSLTQYMPDTLHLLATVLTKPALKDRDIIRKRGEQLASLKSQNEQPGYIAEVTFTSLLFGDQPYGHPSEGKLESVEKLKPADVRGFYKQYYRTGSAIIAVVGDVDAGKIKDVLEKELAGIEGTVAPFPAPEDPKVAPGAHLEKIDRNVTQANLILGFGGVARSNPDYYRIQIANYIYGGGSFASRLFQTVRSKQGLAYSIHSSFVPGKFPGSFQVVLQTKNQTANQALREVLAQMRKMQTEPVTEEELDAAKKFLVGSFPLRIDTQASLANFMLQVEFYGLGLDYADRYPSLINSVTREDVQKAAQQYFHPEAYIVVAAANQKEADISLDSAQSH